MVIMAYNEALKILILLIIFVCFESVKTEPTVIPLSRTVKFILQSFEPTFDSKYITDFRRVSADDNIYDCVIAKDIRVFFIDVIVSQVGKNRELYRHNNMEGCVFLSNPLLNRLFHGFYENLVVNRTDPLKCPIKAGSYLFRNAFSNNALPQIHPKGNFSLNLRLKSNAYDAVMLDLKWLYRLAKR